MDYAYLVVIFVMVMLDIALIGFKVPLLGFLFSIISFCIVAVANGQADNIPYYPYPHALLGLTAVVTMISSGLTLKRGG